MIEATIRAQVELQYALDRMSTPLHASRLSGATAAEDARCMAIIRAEIDRLTRERDEARTERDALVKQGEAFRHLVDACKLLSSEAEEYEFDDGMGRGALLDYWYEFDRQLDAAIDAQIEQERSDE